MLADVAFFSVVVEPVPAWRWPRGARLLRHDRARHRVGRPRCSASMLSVTQPVRGRPCATARSSRCCSRGEPAVVMAAAKALAHWLLTGLPLIAGRAAARRCSSTCRARPSPRWSPRLLLGTPMPEPARRRSARRSTLGLRGAGVLLIAARAAAVRARVDLRCRRGRRAAASGIARAGALFAAGRAARSLTAVAGAAGPRRRRCASATE